MCANIHEFYGEDQQKGLYRKICEKTVPALAHEFCGDDHVFWGSQASNYIAVAPSMLLSLGHNPRLGEHDSRLGGHKQ